MDDVLRHAVDAGHTPPKGWLTAVQWADRDGISRRQMSEKLSQLVSLGRAKSKRIQVRNAVGSLTSVPHYWVEAISPHVQ